MASFQQWSESDGNFTPVGNTVTAIKPGYYDVFIIQGHIWFEPVRPRTDDLLEFPSSASQAVLRGIRDFWDREAKFRKYGLPFKRGVLLYGPPGSGKTSTIQIVAREVVERGGIVVTFPSSTEVFLNAYRALRDIQPETPMVVLLEDLDTILRQVNESKLLNMLDGVEEMDRVLFVASCFTPDTRFLTADLRWVPCGELSEGDELWAFDADKPTGRGARRRYAKSVVTRSEPAYKECVRVTLDTGESFVCTTDHPWLTYGYRPGEVCRLGWTEATDLLRAPDLVRPFRTWETETSWEAGWLAGMLDGEGSISKSTPYRAVPSTVTVAQNVGPIADRIADAVTKRVDAHVYLRKGRHDKQQIVDTRGGLAAALKLIGQVRAERLINRVDLTGGMMHAKFAARVVNVEPVGVQLIQSITTSTGTYIAEGFACHNTNYPEKLDPRITNRPSRFDIRIPVSPPNVTARKMYLESLLQDDDDLDIKQYVMDTAGMSLAHLKELFVSAHILGVPYDTAIKRLRDMESTTVASTDEFIPDEEAEELAEWERAIKAARHLTGQYL